MSFVPSEILKTIVFLGYKLADQSFRFSGTAFFVDRPAANDLPEYGFCYLVTARHVIEKIKDLGLTSVFIRLERDHGGDCVGRSTNLKLGQSS